MPHQCGPAVTTPPQQQWQMIGGQPLLFNHQSSERKVPDKIVQGGGFGLPEGAGLIHFLGLFTNQGQGGLRRRPGGVLFASSLLSTRH